MDEKILHTIGHSNQTIEEFILLLNAYCIDCIIDIRSVPYSKYTPQFNSEALKTQLNKHGVLYAHFGNEFGARRTDCLQSTEFRKKGMTEIKQQVNFELGVTTNNFIRGVERLQKAISQGRHISLMCSEADPLGCHRFSFISRYFHENGWDVRHIVRDEESGAPNWRSHRELEQKMILEYVMAKKLQEIPGQCQPALLFDFGDGYNEQQQRVDAYRLKNHEIGWIPTDNNDTDNLIDKKDGYTLYDWIYKEKCGTVFRASEKEWS